MKVVFQMKRQIVAGCSLALCCFAGCVSVDSDAVSAQDSIRMDQAVQAVGWSEHLAKESVYSKNLGAVEAGRVKMLCGDFASAETWFRTAVDSAIDRKEKSPKIKLGDVGNTILASTLTDDRTREYYLEPYELNLALSYGLIAQVVNGRKEDALADARLAVYVQDNLAETYGADVGKASTSDNASATKIYGEQSAAMEDVMAGTRNSWENPVLWWLTGVLFEADGDLEMAWQSYRKANAVRGGNAVFSADVARADAGTRTPAKGFAKLVVVYEEGLVPIRKSLKVPVPLYTMMSIDIPQYDEKYAYSPNRVSVDGAQGPVAAAPALDVRALAYRDLHEHLPGIIVRNVTRATAQTGAQAAVNYAGNDYARLAMLLGNAAISAIRSADTRSWVTLPDGQQVWEDGAMKPGDYRIGVTVNGRQVSVPVTLSAGQTRLLWIADCGQGFRTALATL